MKQLKIIFIALIGAAVLAAGIALCALDRPDYSEAEKRSLAEFPAFTLDSYLSGSYTSGINKYYNDTIPGRDFFKELTGKLTGLSGLRPDNIKVYGLKDQVSTDTSADTTASRHEDDVTMPYDAETAAPPSDTATEETTAADTGDTAAETTSAAETTADTEPETTAPETESPGEIVELIVNKTSLELYAGEKYTFDVRLRSTGNPDKTVTLTAEPAEILRLNGFTVTGKKPGSAVVTFTASNGMSVSCNVTVTGNPDGDGEINDDYLSENGIIIAGTRGMCLYGGSYAKAELYAQSLNNYYDDLDGKVNVYSMIIPTACEFYCPEQYASYNSSQLTMINYIRDRLGDNVKFVDAYTALSKHTDEQIYLRTDHHWAPLGAYYAAEVFAGVAGVKFPALSEYTEVVKEDFLGTMYSVYTQDAVLLNNPEDFVYYVPQNQITTTYSDRYGENTVKGSYFVNITSRYNYYCVFMGSDDKITHVSTDAGTGRTLVVIKESFGNAVPGYLFSAFDDIYVIDLRYFKLNAIDFIKEKGATDLLFATCTFTATGISNMLETIRTQ